MRRGVGLDKRYVPIIKLKDIYIGEVDGKKEASKENFLDVFYQGHPVVNKSQRNDIYFIFGRKGTGKTILAHFLKEQYFKNGFKTKIIDVHDFEVDYLIEDGKDTVQLDSYYLFWKWNILKHIAEVIIQDKRVIRRISFTKAGRIYKLLQNRYATKGGYITGKYISSRGREIAVGSGINGNGERRYTIGGKLRGNTETEYRKAKYYNEIRNLEKIIKKAMKEKEKFLIIYDDIDELRIGATDKGKLNLKLVEKMFSAIKDVNMMINKECKKNGSKVMLFFRSDIKDMVNSGAGNLNKIVSDSQAILDWHYNLDRRPYEEPLMELVLNKIKHSNENLEKVSTKDIYENFFSSKVDGINVVRYLKRYSFGKPRDFIKYLNIIKDEYPDKDKFVSYTFKRCEDKFSTYFYDELMNELSISENKEFCKECLELIRNYKRPAFSYKEICKYYRENEETYKNIFNCRDAVVFLYKKGILGNSWIYKRNRKGKEIYHFSWSYRNDSHPEPNFGQKFVVHKAIHKKFSMS